MSQIERDALIPQPRRPAVGGDLAQRGEKRRRIHIRQCHPPIARPRGDRMIRHDRTKHAGDFRKRVTQFVERFPIRANDVDGDIGPEHRKKLPINRSDIVGAMDAGEVTSGLHGGEMSSLLTLPVRAGRL